MGLEDLFQASADIDRHLPTYQRAKQYYDGTDESKYLNNMIEQFFADNDFSGTLNYASIPVDAVADRLQLLSIKGPTDAVTKAISELWTANKMQLRFGQFILDVLTYGEYYVAVWPDSERTGDLFDLEAEVDDSSVVVPLNHKAKMMFCDASTTRAFYDDGGEHLYTARKWQQKDANGKDIFRMNLYYTDRLEKYFWDIEDDITMAQPWFDAEQDEWPMENPYEEIPIFHFSTAFPHGIPEHKALYGVQDALNKIFQTHIASIEYLGFPIIYTLMDETSAAGTSDFEYSPIDSNDSGASDVNQLKNNPGEVWAIRANSIGQIEPAGSANFIESLKTYKEIASEVSGLPARLFSSSDGQHPGADAVNAADAVLRQRVVDRSVLLSEPLKAMIAFAMRLAFDLDLTATDISIQWRPQKIEIDSAMIIIFQFKLQLGIPEEQILTEMGYTDTEISLFQANIDKKRQVIEDARQAGMENAAKAARTSGSNSPDNNNERKENVKGEKGTNSDT